MRQTNNIITAANNNVGIRIDTKQPPPVTIRRALLRRPGCVVGIPVAFATFLFISVTPVKRFQLKPYAFFRVILLLLLFILDLFEYRAY